MTPFLISSNHTTLFHLSSFFQFTSLPFISPHLTSLPSISPHLTSLSFISPRLTSSRLSSNHITLHLISSNHITLFTCFISLFLHQNTKFHLYSSQLTSPIIIPLFSPASSCFISFFTSDNQFAPQLISTHLSYHHVTISLSLHLTSSYSHRIMSFQLSSYLSPQLTYSYMSIFP